MRPDISPWTDFYPVGLLPVVALGALFLVLITFTVGLQLIAKMRIRQQKDAFLANVSHELRTPLTSVVLASQLMESDSVGATDQKQLASVIHLSAALLLSLVSDLLDLTRLQAGQKVVLWGGGMEPFQLIDVVAVCVGGSFISNSPTETQLVVRSEPVDIKLAAEHAVKGKRSAFIFECFFW